MKKLLFVSTLLLSSLSLTAVASGTGEHAHGAGHDDHASAIGKPGNPAKVTRTMTVDMSDAMRFTPATINVKRGETVKFIVKNSGKIKHEMVLGTMQELKEHAEVMRKNPEMEHADENQVSVDPGKTGEIVWQFTKAGTFDFACLQPGHFEAGMKGTVAVK
ncbi:plastocyanin/azurin family copper-binding protein [Herbaspirillum sp. RV1423]|uniref:cupredoxin domain-containing protein n=1 Tax=Herbaspirillum sp. RV1423 TaxID=1443993 RepID=UPI000556CF5A|nr:cupredoxin family protein [Herbaspirillum sp. RV1423]